MPNATIVNFAGGETAPKSRGRFDLPWYQSSLRKLVNFIAEVQGPARYRPGFRFAWMPRANRKARIIPFQFSSTLQYLLEFSDQCVRAATQDGRLTGTTVKNVTAASQAAHMILTVDSTGINTGDTIIVDGVVGMTQLNGRQFVVDLAVGTSLYLSDPGGGFIDSRAFSAYISGGTVTKVQEVVSPYLEADLDAIQYATDGVSGVMYLVHPKYAPRKLTIDANGTITLATYSRTNNPFASSAAVVNLASAASVTLVGGTKATVVTLTAGQSAAPGVLYTVSLVVGMTGLNGNSYLVTFIPPAYDPLGNLKPGTNQTRLQNLDGSEVDSSGFGTYTSGGTLTPQAECPLAVAFVEQRLGFFGSNQRPNCIFLSRSPDASGNTRYDDFTGGTNADHACFFALAPISGQVDRISWARATPTYTFIGAYGGPYRISGAGLDQPITPTSINVRQFDAYGCEPAMAVGGAQLYFIQRGGTTIRAPRLDNPYLGLFTCVDLCLNAEHIPYSPLKRLAFQVGRPDVLWALRNDGVLCGVTVQGTQDLAGWHRHLLGGYGAKVLDVVSIQRTNKNDRVWVVVERTIGGLARRSVEYLDDENVFPDPEDFYSGRGNTDADDLNWQNAMYRVLEKSVHLDSAMTFDGSARGVAAGATLTPSAVSGAGVTLTASAAVFLASDVGSEIWHKPSALTGAGAGRAVITAYISATQVTVTTSVAFDSTAAIPAGDWYFATNALKGAYQLRGGTVAVVTDGAVYSDGGISGSYPAVSVNSVGEVTLDSQTKAAVIHIGYPYEGFLLTHNLEMGAKSGPAQTKPRNITEMFIRFLNSLGVDFGTGLYTTEAIPQRPANAITSRPAPPFSGLRKLPYSDQWSTPDQEKQVVVAQRLPLPCIVQFVDLRFGTTDED